MVKRRPKAGERRGSRASEVARAASQKPALSVGKKVLFAFVAVGGFFVTLEVVLALWGVQPVLQEEDPYVGFASRIPLFVEERAADGETYLVTARNKLRWFNSQRFLKQKPAGTYRIFSLGGSTTYGRPYQDATSFSGWLREMLPLEDPTRGWEVINAGGISYASYRVAGVVEELAAYEPDLFIVYTGHNEFLERRTYQNLLAAPAALTEIVAVAGHTRIYAAMRSVVRFASGQLTADSGGPREVLPGEVDTMLAHTVGPQDYTRDDEQRKLALEHFRFNVRRIIDLARAAGAQVVLVTPASNLKDFSPFKSEHLGGLSETEIHRFEDVYGRGRQAHAAGDLEAALRAFEAAGAIDDRHADLHYQRGRVLYELARYEEAKATLRRSLDEDICPLRALTPINRMLVEIATETETPLIDFAAAIESRAEHGIPGSDYFLDHVHPTIEAHRLLALAVVDTLHQEDILEPAGSRNAEAVAAVTRKIESSLDSRSQGIALHNMARLFSWVGQMEEAERLARQAIELLGEDAETYTVLGQIASGGGKPDEAVQHLRRALLLDPGDADAHINLGLVLLGQDQLDDAIHHLRTGLRLDPESVEAHTNLGVALAAKGDSRQALQHYERALQLHPGHAEAHSNLGAELVSRGRIEEGIQHFREALRLRPRYPDAHINLGLALASQGDTDEAVRHYQEALRIQPGAAKAHYNLGVAFLGDDRIDEASHHFRQALTSQPHLAEAHYNLGLALLSQGKLEAAISRFRETLSIDAGYGDEQTNRGLRLLAEGRINEALQHLGQARRAEAAPGEAP